MSTEKNWALVLTGGGARGAYQAGVLKYIGEHMPEAHFETLVGSSAGAINVAGLATAGGNLQLGGPRIAEIWAGLNMRQVFRTDVFSLAKIAVQWMTSLAVGGVSGRPAAHSLVDSAPLRKLLDELYQPALVAQAIEEGKLRNVVVSATEVHSGSSVTFIQSKIPKIWERARRRAEMTELTVEHIMASAAIPLLFPSVVINNRQYVDGCIRSTTPLGPATRLGATKILSIGVRQYYMREAGNFFRVPTEPEPKPTPAQLGALVLNSLFNEALDADAEHLERLNSILPETSESHGMRKVDVLVLRPSEDLGEIATRFRDRAPSAVRFMLRGLGSEAGRSSDILSYLLFVPEYLQALVDLGYRDAREEDGRIRAFLREE
ncbi:MAG: patatin [Proteobacteria bacterium]|nr:MAG: patatin [Pseudomonadota bacterium]